MGLEDAGDLVMHAIISRLDAREAATVCCVSRRLRASASDESLWAGFCARDLDLSAPLDTRGNLVPSFKVAYQTWREDFSMYPWLLVKRVKRCWDRIRNWLTINFPEAKATLRGGASEADLQELENVLRVKLPLPTRILYRFSDGQELKGTDSGSLLGIIGGYSFYDHLVNVYLLPLSEIILQTKTVMRVLGFSVRSKYIVVAASASFRQKVFFLNCGNSQLYVGTRNLPTDGKMMPCVPSGLITPVHDSNGDKQQDAMLLWLEEHGRRLQDGLIKVRDDENGRSINLFPEKPPLCSTAVTNGVKIRASAVLIPELCDLQHESEKYIFSYSIRMSLLPDGCVLNGLTFESCQLHWRHWVIRANDVVLSDFNGEAVIGKYPLLYPGEKEFVYESCTPLPLSQGSLEGSFTFVPGRLANPEGAPFEAEVARFPLQVPDYVF